MLSMKLGSGIALCLALAALIVWGQRNRGVVPAPPNTPTWEYRSLVPEEIGVGQYKQVEWFDVQALGIQGWELVSVTPWVIRNEEHKGKVEGMPRVVTQNYVSYYFKRPRPAER